MTAAQKPRLKRCEKISTTQVTYIIFCSMQKTRIMLTDKNKVFRHDVLQTLSHYCHEVCTSKGVGCSIYRMSLVHCLHQIPHQQKASETLLSIFTSSWILTLLCHKHFSSSWHPIAQPNVIFFKDCSTLFAVTWSQTWPIFSSDMLKNYYNNNNINWPSSHVVHEAIFQKLTASHMSITKKNCKLQKPVAKYNFPTEHLK